MTKSVSIFLLRICLWILKNYWEKDAEKNCFLLRIQKKNVSPFEASRVSDDISQCSPRSRMHAGTYWEVRLKYLQLLSDRINGRHPKFSRKEPKNNWASPLVYPIHISISDILIYIKCISDKSRLTKCYFQSWFELPSIEAIHFSNYL